MSAALQPSAISRVRGGIARSNWVWLSLPLLAIAAYITVVRVDFLADDYLLLVQARTGGITPEVFVPEANWWFYRPLGTLFTWRVGWELWGFNAFPYHLIGLVAHALVSLVLGLFIAEISGKRAIGWLAGALFAVFPAHIEAVVWIASQWDLWATLYALLSLWLFVKWWKSMSAGTPRWAYYVGSVACYAIGVFTKESLFVLPPFFLLSAWVALPSSFRWSLRSWIKPVLAMVPFGVFLLLNVAIRLIAWGRLGGYPDVRTDFGTFILNSYVDFGRVLLSPINSLLLNPTLSQLVGLASGVLLLVGLVYYGRDHLRLMLFCLLWLLLNLFPVANLGINFITLESNRFLYLPAVAYCAAVAALLVSFVQGLPHRARGIGIGAIGVILGLSTALSWIQLRPWHTISVQAAEYHDELLRLIPPPAEGTRSMDWFIDDAPRVATGVDVFKINLGLRRHFIGRDDVPGINFIDNIADAPLVTDRNNIFAMRFDYDEAEVRYDVVQAAGITHDAPPPAPSEIAQNGTLWDFRDCSPEMVSQWTGANAEVTCEPGSGLVVTPTNDDPQLVGPPMSLLPPYAEASFMRIRTNARYPVLAEEPDQVMEWFWHGVGQSWAGEKSYRMPVKVDGEAHVYWAFIPAGGLGSDVERLRFDTISREQPARIGWIMLDLVR